MEKVFDRLFLLAASIALLFALGASSETAAVIAMLLAVIISALNSLAKQNILSIGALTVFILAVFYWRDFAFFLPLTFYDANFLRQSPSSLQFVLPGLVSLLVVVPSGTFHFALLIAVFVLMGQMLAERSRQLNLVRNELRKLEDDSREMNLLLQEKNRELVTKSGLQIETARLNERSRIAREIHDHVGHLLSRSILGLGALLVTEKEGEIRKSLLVLKETLTQAMDQIRWSVHGLYAESLDLKTHLEILVADFSFCRVNLDYRLVENPDQVIANCFLAISKEGLNNIIRHSNASEARLILTEHPGFYQLVLEDNGTQLKEEINLGLGLQSITDRVQALGGNFVSEWDGGFRLFISIPKEGDGFASISS